MDAASLLCKEPQVQLGVPLGNGQFLSCQLFVSKTEAPPGCPAALGPQQPRAGHTPLSPRGLCRKPSRSPQTTRQVEAFPTRSEEGLGLHRAGRRCALTLGGTHLMI